MSRLFEFILGSLLVTVFTVASVFFFALQYILRVSGIADCAWRGSVQTWMDLNGDGVVNRDEPPLGNVEIHVNDIGNRLVNISWPAITGHDGSVSLTAPILGCTDTTFEIYVDIPKGYRSTTSSRLQVQPDLWGNLGSEPVYYFGFDPNH